MLTNLSVPSVLGKIFQQLNLDWKLLVGKKITKFLMRTFTCRSTLLYDKNPGLLFPSIENGDVVIEYLNMNQLSLSSPRNKGGVYTLDGRRGGWGVNILEDERNRIALLQ